MWDPSTPLSVEITATGSTPVLIPAPRRLKFGGRTDAANIPADLVSYLYETITEEMMQAVFPNAPAIIYGEGYGAGINSGGSYSKTKQFIVFDVLVGKRHWLTWENVCDVSTKLGLKTVPEIGTWSLEDGIEFVKNGFFSPLAKQQTGEAYQAEGIVGRTLQPLFDRRGRRIIIKLKTRDF